MEIKYIYDIVRSRHLFCCMGIEKSITGFERVQSEQKAFELWKEKDFTDARIIAWEIMRTKIISDVSSLNYWDREFTYATQEVLKAVRKVYGLKSLLSRYSLAIDDFSRDLPFVGAIGEIIAFGDDHSKNFFRFQMDVFSKGHWVCNWKRKIPLERGKYPNIDFGFY